jgi:hypothetical protein
MELADAETEDLAKRQLDIFADNSYQTEMRF